jgi:hypothetical protein
MPQILIFKNTYQLTAHFQFCYVAVYGSTTFTRNQKPEQNRRKQRENLIRSTKHLDDTGFTFSGFPYWSMDIQGEVALGYPGWLPGQAERYCVTVRAAWCPLLASVSLAAWRLDLQQQYTGSYPTVLTTDLPPHNILTPK